MQFHTLPFLYWYIISVPINYVTFARRMLFNIKKKNPCALSLITMHSACDSNKNIAADALYALGCGGILRYSLYNKALTPYRLLFLRVQSNRCSWKTRTASHKSRQHSFHIMFTRNTTATLYTHTHTLTPSGATASTGRVVTYHSENFQN